MDQASDFEPQPPYEGSFYTHTDFGVLGRELETYIKWVINNDDSLVIEMIRFSLGKNHEGENIWIDLDSLYLSSPDMLKQKKKDPDLIEEAIRDHNNCVEQYRAEGGPKKLWCL